MPQRTESLTDGLEGKPLVELRKLEEHLQHVHAEAAKNLGHVRGEIRVRIRQLYEAKQENA